MIEDYIGGYCFVYWNGVDIDVRVVVVFGDNFCCGFI